MTSFDSVHVILIVSTAC